MAAAAVDARARTTALVALVVTGTLFAFHLWLSSSMDDALLSDGMAYLANARWLGGAGGETWMGQTGFYNAGYSAVLAPLFFFMDDPRRIFRGVLVVNAVLATLAFPVYWALAKRIGLTRWLAMAAGLVAAVYPSVLLQASIEWSDNLYHLVFALLLLSLHHLVAPATPRSGPNPTRLPALNWDENRWGWGWGAAVGFFGAYLYAVHPRALGVIPVLVLALLVLAWRGTTDRRAALVGLAVLVVTFFVVRAVHNVLIDAMWADDRPVTEGDVLSRLTEPSLVKGLFLRLFGHSWYLLVASFGLVAAAITWLWRRRTQPFALTVILLCGATMGAGALMMSDATRVDHFVYGRYNEGFLPALLVIGVAGLVELVRTRHVVTLLLANAAGIVALGAITVATNGGDTFSGDVMPLNVLGILAWESSRSRVDVAAVSMIAVVITAVVLLARTKALPLALAVVLVTFAGGSARARTEVLDPWSSFFSGITELPEAVDALPTDVRVTYERAGFYADAGVFYQFELLDRGVTFWDEGEDASTDLVITHREWPDAGAHGARLIFAERYHPQALWVLPGELADDLDAAGFVFDGDPAAPMPESSLAGSIDEPPAVDFEAGRTVTLPVHVRHPAGGDPWPGLGDLETEQGAVRVLAEWSDGRTVGIGDLPKTLLPGQELDVNVILPVPAERGEHELTIRLVQVGAGPMSGGRVLSVAVR